MARRGKRDGSAAARCVSALLILATANGCAGQRTASLGTCALVGSGVGLVAGTAYGGFDGGGFETEDAAIGAFIGLGGGAVVGAMICALIPTRSDASASTPQREPPVAPLPEPIDSRGAPPQN